MKTEAEIQVGTMMTDGMEGKRRRRRSAALSVAIDGDPAVCIACAEKCATDGGLP